MTILHRKGSWIIMMHGNEHPPIHVHVLHPNGDASISLDGVVLNRGIPAKVIAQAMGWITGHAADIRAEWKRLNNPSERKAI